MSPARATSIELADVAATRRLAQRLAGGLGAQDVVYLSGPIGAGKTEFARALIRHLAGAEIDVPSPSYTLVQTYDLPRFAVVHVDLYRLADTSEIAELGVDDLASGALLLVEWAERAGGLLPPPTLTIDIEIRGDARRAVPGGKLAETLGDAAFV